LSAVDPISKQSVYITKYLCLKSKTTSQHYFNHLYERILLTSHLSHPNVRRILSWYIADACLYSITGVIQQTLRHAIQSELFSIDRIRHLTFQIVDGTVYLQSKGLCPLTPWYTTNIELTPDDRIRLCSPTISTTKLNGRRVPNHHLWRHAPECLIRMIVENESHREIIDDSKEDVWSIACIIIEMMIKTILFRPQNDDPSLQLYCIVQLVGGLSPMLIECFPRPIQQMFRSISFDQHQQRLDRLLKQIFSQYSKAFDENLFDLLKQMLQFQCDQRLELQQIQAHRFFSRQMLKSTQLAISKKTSIHSIRSNDLIHLCTKLQLENPRWLLTLKEICLLKMILHSQSLPIYQLNSSLQNQFKQLMIFFHAN